MCGRGATRKQPSPPRPGPDATVEGGDGPVGVGPTPVPKVGVGVVGRRSGSSGFGWRVRGEGNQRAPKDELTPAVTIRVGQS